MKRIILCDIDGTLATIGDRAKILEKDKLTEKDYDEFNARSAASSCIQDIANIIRNLKDAETKIYLITAREKKWKKITQHWLKLTLGKMVVTLKLMLCWLFLINLLMN